MAALAEASGAEGEDITAGDKPVASEVAQAVATEPAGEGAPDPAGANEAAPPQKAELSPPQCAAKLAALFPALFGPEGPPKPIKLRIQADIQQRAPGLFTRKVLSIVLHRHTTSTPYLKALVAAPSRFDLDGQPAGEIAEEHRQAAREEVERRRAIVAARRAAEAQARGPKGPRPPRPEHSSVGADAPSAEAAVAPNDAATGGTPDQPRRDRPPRPHGERPGGRRAERNSGPRDGSRDGRRDGHGAGRDDGPWQRPREAGPRQGAAHSPAGDRPARADRPPRPDRANRERASSHPRQDQRPLSPQWQTETPRPRPHPEGPPSASASAEDPARRERALLLRTYEASSLTKANFCVLKRISEAELDAQLALARQERGPARPRS